MNEINAIFLRFSFYLLLYFYHVCTCHASEKSGIRFACGFPNLLFAKSIQGTVWDNYFPNSDIQHWKNVNRWNAK